MLAVVGVAHDALSIDDKRARQALRVAGGLALSVAARRRPRPGGNGVGRDQTQQVAPLNAERLVERRRLIGQTVNTGRQLAAKVAGVLRFAQTDSQDSQPGGFNFLVVQL